MTASPSDGALFRRVLDRLGRDIIEDRLDSPLTIDAIVTRTGASRPVVREATRVLVALGMLTASPRIGLRARPRREWDILDAQVIRWRLETTERDLQVRELVELRASIEPEAARLAARRGLEPQAAELVRLGAALLAAADGRDRDGFLASDILFHELLLAMTDSAMLIRLGTVIGEGLRDRAPDDDLQWEHAPRQAELHLRAAMAIAQRDSVDAARTMRQIIESDPSQS